jgi:hypothetical protein
MRITMLSLPRNILLHLVLFIRLYQWRESHLRRTIIFPT